MSYRNVQKFYITKTSVNIPKVKIGRKSLAKASLILFLTSLIIFLILLNLNLVKGVSGSSITKYLGTTPIANLGGTYWNLTDTTGTANTATSVRNARLTGKFIFRPGTANSQLTGNPDSGVPAGYGWGTNYTLKGTIPAGTWTFQVKTTSTSATGQGFVGVVVYKNCTGTSTRLFGVFNTTRNVLASTAATITTITTNQPAFDVDGCYLKVEYWLNVTVAGGSNTGTVTFTVNELSEFIQFPVDTTPPQWSNQSQSTSTPAVGDQVNLSAYWTDDTALSQAWLATNETGIWENKTTYGSPISFAAAVNGWSNFTWQNSSIPAGTVVAWRIYANDTSGNENVTDIMTFKVSDTQPPTYSLNSTNSTIAGTPVSHNLYWQDDVGLSHAIFSFDNCTGSMQNISVMSLSGIASWSNFTVVINSTVGCTIRWCVYANDTSNNWNGTSCENPFSYVTTSGPYLEVELIQPNPNFVTNVIQNSTFIVNATVFCRVGSCGFVNGTLLYNLTSSYPDTPINTSFGDKPFFVNETPALAMKACSNNPLNANDFCNLTWIVNATGNIDTAWKIGVYFNSSDPNVNPNSTSNATVVIVSCTVDFSLTWSSIDFGTLLPNTFNNSAPGNLNNTYNITVNPGSCNLDLYIRGTDLVNTTFNSIIKVGNISWSNISSNLNDGFFRLSETNSLIKSNVPEKTNVTTWYWLDVPPVYAGKYNGTIYITGVKR
jgi:hypothetical protein